MPCTKDDNGAGDGCTDKRGDNNAVSGPGDSSSFTTESMGAEVSTTADPLGLCVAGGSPASLPAGEEMSVEELLFQPAPSRSLSARDATEGPDVTGSEGSKLRTRYLPGNPTGEPTIGWSMGLVAMGTCGLVGEVPSSGESVGVCGE